MRKLLRVSWYEYWKLMRQRGFWVGTIGFPLLLIFFFFVSIIFTVVLIRDQRQPVGYVDYAGVLHGAAGKNGGLIEIRPYSQETEAQQALKNEEIQAYYVLPADYLQSHEISLFVLNNLPPPLVEESFQTLLRSQLLSDVDASVRTRVVNGAHISLHVVDQDEDANTRTLIKGGIAFIVVMGIIIVMGDVAGYASTIVENERENRTLEMLMTTLTPNQFIMGKIIGLVGVTLTRPFIWFLMALPFLGALLAAIPSNYRGMIDTSFILLIIMFIIPGITLFFGLMTMASVVIADPRYSGQMASLLNMILMFSVFFGFFVIVESDHPVVIFFSFFPLTSFIVIVLRQVMVDVPLWHIGLSWLLLLGSAGVSLWLAARFFNAGRLFSGRAFQWRLFWQKRPFRRRV